MGAPPPASINLFTCTLGEAQAKGITAVNRNLYRTVNQFIDFQANYYGDELAVAYPRAPDGRNVQIFTFRQLRSVSLHVAQYLDNAGNMDSPTNFDKELENQKCVGLLGRSTLDLLFIWLALMRKGVSVLLLAPQCSPEALRHLCSVLHVKVVFYDEYYSREAANAEAVEPPISKAFRKYPWQHPTATESLQSCIARGLHGKEDPEDQAIPLHHDEEARVPYYHHTSGTLSGLPKPIAQSHMAACVALPIFDGRGEATFTTTPLYHGGIADCFRSWTSASPIFLFPGEVANITAEAIIGYFSAINRKDDNGNNHSLAQRKWYFTGVPYVLRNLCDSAAGIGFLRRMNIVGVGGASLPSDVGDSLVDLGVNLVSRFGSAECGFLLSSHRNYEIDKDWEYLRLNDSNIPIVFEPSSDFEGKCELVVKSGWPHLGKKNREDGSFATSDLFEPHPRILNAWKCSGRSDSQITLVTGKKFDPVPLEEAITKSSALIREVFVFGNGMSYPGALIFRSVTAAYGRNEQIRNSIWPGIATICRCGPEHARIPKDMLIILGHEEPLKITSKGTVVRRWAEQHYARIIKNAYEGTSADLIYVSDEDMAPYVMKLILDLTGQEPNTSWDYDTEFPARLIDSIQATRIRSFIQKQILGIDNTVQLPWNVVYICGTVNKLAEYVISARIGFNLRQDDTEEMKIMVEQYLDKLVSPSVSWLKALQAPTQRVVILTGATGALGSHVLSQLRDAVGIAAIICLVRASNVDEARDRVLKALRKRKLDHRAELDSRVSYVPAQLDRADLGLSQERYSMLRQTATDIIHVAWEVNFIRPLQYFKDSLEGLVNLINLSLSCDRQVHFLFCSSTASIARMGSRPTVVLELASENPTRAADVGYAKSKWVAECICWEARKNTVAQISVVRIGQLTGDTVHGIWNETEAWPLMLSTVYQLGCLPEIDETLTWLPIDIAAAAILQLTANHRAPLAPQISFYHLVNNSQATHWNDMLHWLQEFHPGPIRIVSYEEWLEELDRLEDNNPAKVLSTLWRNSLKSIEGQEAKVAGYAINNMMLIAPIMLTITPVDKELMRKIWEWMMSVNAGDSRLTGN
ncbi:hypothetical protein ACMFMG_008053 [Clarireedia jacksonii]